MDFHPGKTVLPRNIYKPEEIVSKLRQVNVWVAQGNKVPDAVRLIAIEISARRLEGEINIFLIASLTLRQRHSLNLLHRRLGTPKNRSSN